MAGFQETRILFVPSFSKNEIPCSVRCEWIVMAFFSLKTIDDMERLSFDDLPKERSCWSACFSSFAERCMVSWTKDITNGCARSSIGFGLVWRWLSRSLIEISVIFGSWETRWACDPCRRRFGRFFPEGSNLFTEKIFTMMLISK